MTARPEHPTIRRARKRMLTAAGYYTKALRELKAAMRSLERTADFKRTARLEKARVPTAEGMTLAWWLHNCILSARDDGREEADDWLRVDAAPGGAERSMRDFVETDRQDRERFASKHATKLKRAA